MSGIDKLRVIAAIVLAWLGDSEMATQISNDLSQDFPMGTLLNARDLPTIRAALEIHCDNPSTAVSLLETAAQYEFGTRNIGSFVTIYIRGLAYLSLQNGEKAKEEFQKILDHRGVNPTSPLYSLAHLGVARALALTGDELGSRQQYQNFLALWKDADPDIPILIEAKAEYEKLKEQ